jgi:hypothetical protein
VTRTGREQSAGKPARTGPDLDHRSRGQVAGGAGDATREVEVEQKMLTKRLARRQPMPRDDITKRRQTGR